MAATTSSLHKDEQTYHELFSSPEADVVLCSADGIQYRVRSYTLRTTSGLFRTLFSLPQPKTQTEARCEPLPTHENAETLTILLLILSGRPIPDSIKQRGDTIERVLSLAEAWDAQGAITAIRPILSCPEILETKPFLLYRLASHFGWEEERKLASSYTLTFDIFADGADGADRSSALQESLERLSSKDLLALLDLRRRRCETFNRLLDSVERFAAGNSSSYICPRCGITALDNKTWRALKLAMRLEMDRRPLGDGIVGGPVHGIGGNRGEIGVIAWPEADACWEAVCTKEGCGGLHYDRNATLRQIRDCVEALPMSTDA